jgi:glycosyltransferase involved in cell wall biosynthesis
MRILHLASEYPPQHVFGLGRYVCDLSRELARQGHAVHVLTNSIGESVMDTVDHGVHVHRVLYPPPPKPPGMVAPPMAFNLHLQQRAYVLGREKCGNPEVVVSHDWLTAAASRHISRRWHIPHVWTVHDTVLGKTFGRLETSTDIMISALERWAADQADLVIVNSQLIGAEVQDGYGGEKGKTRLVHCGVDPDAWKSDQHRDRLSAFRLVLALPNELLFTYVGRLDAEKGIDTLINAFSLVLQSGVKARLAIAGSGFLEDTIRSHIAQLNIGHAVHLYGYLKGETLKALYSTSDLHICPSHYEPFGLVAVEAMAAGVPIIVSRTGGLAEIVSNNKVGRAVEPDNVEALAQAMRELAADAGIRKRLGAAGEKHVRRNFSWSQIAKKAVTCYQSARLLDQPAISFAIEKT